MYVEDSSSPFFWDHFWDLFLFINFKEMFRSFWSNFFCFNFVVCYHVDDLIRIFWKTLLINLFSSIVFKMHLHRDCVTLRATPFVTFVTLHDAFCDICRHLLWRLSLSVVTFVNDDWQLTLWCWRRQRLNFAKRFWI